MGKDNIDDRMTMALHTLKKEMDDLRTQDVELMKQLLYIRKTIQTIARHRRRARYPKTIFDQQRRSVSSCMQTVTEPTEELHVECQRRLSAPVSDDSMGSSLSLEEAVFLDDFSELSESEEDLFVKAPKLPRIQSLSIIRDLDKDICDEDLLKTNIRVWKLSKAELFV